MLQTLVLKSCKIQVVFRDRLCQVDRVYLSSRELRSINGFFLFDALI